MGRVGYSFGKKFVYFYLFFDVPFRVTLIEKNVPVNNFAAGNLNLKFSLAQQIEIFEGEVDF